MKKNIVFIIFMMVLILPVNVKGLNGSVNLSCKSTDLTVNTSTTCTLSGYSSEYVSGVSLKLTSSGNISISNISTASIWAGDGEGGNIGLYTADNKKGNFAIATFKVTATSNVGTGKISVGSVVFSDAIKYSDVSIAGKNLNITVSPKQSTPTTQPVEDSNSEATLESITISPVNIEFSKDVYNYNIEVPYETEEIKISAKATDSKAIVSIPNDLKLKLGLNSFEIKVTAVDGTTKTYTLNVKRLDKKLSDNSKLKSLAINDKRVNLSDGVYSYSFSSMDTSTANVKFETDDDKAKAEVYGQNSIGLDDVIVVKVTAEDGSISEYNIYVSGKSKSETNLPFIIVSVIMIISIILNMLLAIKKNNN